MFRFIKLNKAKCLRCNAIVISNPETASKEETCDCGRLKISGGGTSMLRSGIQDKDYVELSQLSFNGECPNVIEETEKMTPELLAISNRSKNKGN